MNDLISQYWSEKFGFKVVPKESAIIVPEKPEPLTRFEEYWRDKRQGTI